MPLQRGLSCLEKRGLRPPERHLQPQRPPGRDVWPTGQAHPGRQRRSSTLKVRGRIISHANSSLGGFCSCQRIFPSQIIQVLLMVIISHLLLEGPFYEEERYERLVPRQEERERKRALKALERLGYAVILEKVA